MKKAILSVLKIIETKERTIIIILKIFKFPFFKKYNYQYKKVFDKNDPTTSFSKGLVGISSINLKPNKSIE